MSTVTGAPITRRRLLAGGAGIAVGAAAGLGIAEVLSGSGGPSSRPLPMLSSAPAPLPASGSAAQFRSSPALHPPLVHPGPAIPLPGTLLIGPGSSNNGLGQGPLLLDGNGDPVWFAQLARPMWASNVAAVDYRGRSALAWWQGDIVAPGFGIGEGVIIDSGYQQLTRVGAGNGRAIDLHEFHVTPQGTALFTCHPPLIRTDLTAVGGPSVGYVLESVIQEVDIASGRLLMEWRSLDHVPITDSYKPFGEPYDYFHANSVDILPDGNLLISARHTSALYKLDRRTGAVIWRMGGKHNQFDRGPGSEFAWQHHARSVSGGRVTVFDNGSNGVQTTLPHSRGLILHVDENARRVTLERAYIRNPPVSAGAMGSMQLLPSGHVVVGWGTEGHTSVFTPEGRMIGDVALPAGVYSYRAALAAWDGHPGSPPALSARWDPRAGRTILWVSWNGDARAVRWEVHAGRHPRALRAVGQARRHGFETAIAVPGDHPYAAVTAIGAGGEVLVRGPAVKVVG